ncbi:MAG: D-alanyl-D-alanine carboxypeptidase [Butyrivibrio sp.]|nr:D-alanyl-D-alanine carboxypeptidase [Butyrivibrio sp.]
MGKSKFSNLIYRTLSILLALSLGLLTAPVTALADTDYAALAQERKELPIQSNSIAQWPHGPEITAQAAIVMDAATGTILYSKNIHEELFPASTTKIMTCLLAVENASLSDTITFSNDAVFSVPQGGSNIGMDVGQSITLEQALYGIMVGSANEVANAVAEHVSGSIDAFVDLMNERAKELGCTNTHFSNTNGLQADDHYTSAYDLALIAKAFFDNELLCKVGNTARYHFTATANQPDDFYLNNKHKLISGEIPYEGILGGKTGYTDLARETLVTCAEKDGLKLVCVVFMEESPSQFTDTVTLFDYAFNNFHSVNVSDNDTRNMPDDSLIFES